MNNLIERRQRELDELKKQYAREDERYKGLIAAEEESQKQVEAAEEALKAAVEALNQAKRNNLKCVKARAKCNRKMMAIIGRVDLALQPPAAADDDDEDEDVADHHRRREEGDNRQAANVAADNAVDNAAHNAVANAERIPRAGPSRQQQNFADSFALSPGTEAILARLPHNRQAANDAADNAANDAVANAERIPRVGPSHSTPIQQPRQNIDEHFALSPAFFRSPRPSLLNQQRLLLRGQKRGGALGSPALSPNITPARRVRRRPNTPRRAQPNRQSHRPLPRPVYKTTERYCQDLFASGALTKCPFPDCPDENYRNATRLLRHLNQHDTTKEWPCQQCIFAPKITNPRQFLEHMEVVHPIAQGGHTCTRCDAEFSSRYLLMEHILVSNRHGSRLRCLCCAGDGYRATSEHEKHWKDQQLRHLRTKFGTTWFRCRFKGCGVTCAMENNMLQHVSDIHFNKEKDSKKHKDYIDELVLETPRRVEVIEEKVE